MPPLPPSLARFPPDFVLGGDFRPHPSDWQKFPTQTGERFYFFLGQHRDPADTAWHADALVAHSYDIYENGTLSTVHYDDTGQDRDLDDLVLEVAIVGRTSWLDLLEAVDQAVVSERVGRAVIERVGGRRYSGERPDRRRPRRITVGGRALIDCRKRAPEGRTPP